MISPGDRITEERDIATADANADLAQVALTRFQRTLAVIGWEVQAMDLDLDRGTVMVEIHRIDGRWIRVDAAPGRAAIERWQRSGKRTIVQAYNRRRCNRIVVDDSEDLFLGRIRADGARGVLRAACAYLADNPAPGRAALPKSAIRAALAPAMNAATTAQLAGESPECSSQQWAPPPATTPPARG